MATDKSEKGLETIIEEYLLNVQGYEKLVSDNYNKDYTCCTEVLEQFILKTQPQKVANTQCFASTVDKHKFFTRLSAEITNKGVTAVLRKGFRYISENFDLYYPLPSELNPTAQKEYADNRFAIMRQLHYSKQNPDLSVDMVLFLNGLPLLTMELKNRYTGQTVENAIKQYKTDRDANDLLFSFKRCAVHLAVDDTDVMMCTRLCGKDSWFLPFNKGNNGGAGNPVNPNGLKTAYLWEEIFEKHSLSDIIENYAQVTIEEKRDKKTGRVKKEEKNIWPRYHQLMCVRSLLADTRENGLGRRYLIQHSAGSGKSNSITWLAYQAVELMQGAVPVFDSVIIVTDRVNLDTQIRDNITSFKRLSNLIGWAEDTDTLRRCLNEGKKIIITIIHKFSFILEAVQTPLKNKHFAIIIDEAHSSQSGGLAAKMNIVLSDNVEKEDDTPEDKINKVMEGRKLLKNANYYAFTATPKNKTLEMFGVPVPGVDENGMPCTQHYPFHEYTMRQAIEEGFIMDVLKCYTPYSSFYKIIKATEDDPNYDRKQAQKKLRGFVEKQPETVEEKSRVIVNHFCTNVAQKIRGKARAMVITGGIERAIKFYHEISKQLEERKSPFKAVVAFSGDKEYGGKVVNEAILNGFPSAQIEDKVEEEPYRILVVADKFQTGYDQPLLHTMYVDKQLSDVKAVQTLSRLNRCHPDKHDTFVLDFANDTEDIKKAFQRYYTTTILSHETDPNKLNDLILMVEEFNIYTMDDVEKVAEINYSNGERGKIDAIIDGCVERFKAMEEDAQINCKSALKNYVRLYPFLAAVIPQVSMEWEKLYLFYGLLVSKLPKLRVEDWAQGIEEKIDFSNYRLIKQGEVSISLENENAKIDPIPTGTGGGTRAPEYEPLSRILEEFNELYGKIDWEYPEQAVAQIKKLPGLLAQEESFANAAHNTDRATAELESSDLLRKIVAQMLSENTEFARNYLENKDFMAFVNSQVFNRAYAGIVGA